MVKEDNVNVLNIKKSQLDAKYQNVLLKTSPDDVLNKSVPNLNIGPLKLAANKYKYLNAQVVHQLSALKHFNNFLKTFPLSSFSLYS